MIIKKYEKFLESIEDGYSDEFDKRFNESEKKIEQILNLSDEWVREELLLMSDSELVAILNSLKKEESYTDDKQYSFNSIFDVTEYDLLGYISDMIDEFDYIEMNIVSDNEKQFSIELHSTDTNQDLKSEFKWYKENVSDELKTQLLNVHSLNLFSEKFDEEKNKIIINVKRS